MSLNIIDRVTGSLIGLACGDAVGTALEFMPRGSFEPVKDMVGGGPFNLLPGQWTDDTSMALCLGHSLLYKNGFDPTDQMNRYCNWFHHGYMSSTGECFDIGSTVASALNKYLATEDPYSGAIDEFSSGNGSLMRLAPIAIFYHTDQIALIKYAGSSSRTTHGSAECIDACRYFAALLAAAFSGAERSELISSFYEPTTHKVKALSCGKFLNKPYESLSGSGYVIESLESALWCFHKSRSYEEAVLMAANIGNDADTTAAICGQIAGAFYGYLEIPESWKIKLHQQEQLYDMAVRLAHTGRSVCKAQYEQPAAD